jgi:LMBR1 domain-containing protein 1
MSKSWAVRCEPFIYPFKLICGILLGLAILFVMVSLIISLIDRIIYSDCSIGCGFAIKKPVLPNPLDLLLTWSSSVFPVDYIVFLSFISLIVAGTLTGLANIGIKFFWIHLYQLKWRNTVPQGLLTSCIFMMMIVTVFSFTMVFFAPQYTSFGSQHFQNEQGEWQLCDFDHLYNATKAATLDYGMLNTTDPNPRTKGCFSTELVALVNSNFLRGRGYGQVFAVAFYFSNWVFILSFVISTIIALIRKPASFVKMEEDSDDDE